LVIVAGQDHHQIQKQIHKPEDQEDQEEQEETYKYIKHPYV
jgi:hypothetical protein